MNLHGVLITTDGAVRTVSFPVEGDLQEMQRLVGGYLEGIRIEWRGHELYGYVNQEGKLRQLPSNALATHFASHNFDPLAGNVLIFGEGDAAGDDTSPPPAVFAHFGLTVPV